MSTNVMKRSDLSFPTTKSSCGTRWGQKREEGLYPCSEDGTTDDDDDGGDHDVENDDKDTKEITAIIQIK